MDMGHNAEATKILIFLDDVHGNMIIRGLRDGNPAYLDGLFVSTDVQKILGRVVPGEEMILITGFGDDHTWLAAEVKRLNPAATTVRFGNRPEGGGKSIIQGLPPVPYTLTMTEGHPDHDYKVTLVAMMLKLSQDMGERRRGAIVMKMEKTHASC